MASNLLAMASSLLAMPSNLLAMDPSEVPSSTLSLLRLKARTMQSVGHGRDWWSDRAAAKTWTCWDICFYFSLLAGLDCFALLCFASLALLAVLVVIALLALLALLALFALLALLACFPSSLVWEELSEERDS